MKLAKLSLAAIVAAGAMTTFANAASLEEAIKGVDLSGVARYRFTSNQVKGKSNNHTDEHEYKLQTKLLIPVAENLKAGTVFTLVNKDDAADASATSEADNMTMKMDGLWFQYAVDTFSLQAGKFAVATPWTDGGDDGTIGNGALVAFTGVPGWTFAAAGFVNTNLDDITVEEAKDGNGTYSLDASTGQIVENNATAAEIVNIGQENLYALAAIGSVGPVGLQLWGASMTNVIDYSVFGQVDFSMAGFSIGVQANQLKLAKEARGLFTDDSGFYWGVKAGYEMAGFGISAGFTQNDKDMPLYALAADDASGFYFSGGKQINGKYVNVSDATAAFMDLSYTMGAYNFGAGFAYAGRNDFEYKENGVSYKTDKIGKEWYVSAAYNYAKNFQLSTYYSSLDMKEKSKDNDRIRFEAKYSF